MAKKVAIVGGGITGLAAAYHLERDSDAEIELFESSAQLGGKLQTTIEDGYLIEHGPDCFFTRKPGVMELVTDLGLGPQLVEPTQKEFFLLVDGQLHRVPGGLVTFTYSDPSALDSTTFLTPQGKARALDEPNQLCGEAPDEPIQSFFARRFGPEFSRLVAEPLLAGTHGGDPAKLSMQMLYPGYLKLERSHGSLAAGMSSPSGEKRPSFLSFQNGMATLVNSLGSSLKRTVVSLNASLDRVPQADHVLIAIPAPQAANLLSEVRPLLDQIEHRSSTIVTFSFYRSAIGHPLDGTGFLVPPSTQFPITGTTWSSKKWPNRAPEEMVLLRVFIRGLPEEPIQQALSGISDLLSIQGEPEFSRVDRWKDALPQMNVGHAALMDRIESALPPTLTLAGTSYRGVGVPDCLRQAREAADLILARI